MSIVFAAVSTARSPGLVQGIKAEDEKKGCRVNIGGNLEKLNAKPLTVPGRDKLIC